MHKKRYLWFALAVVAATGFACGDDASDAGLGEACSAENKCAAGLECSAEGVCVSVEPECSAEKACPNGKECSDEGKCIDKLTCEDETQDVDCPSGKICQDHKCVEEPKCSKDEECGANGECVDGECKMKPECSTNDECDGDWICQEGQCGPDPNKKDETIEADVAIAVQNADGLITDESGATAEFQVVLERDPKTDVSFSVKSSNADEGRVSPQQLNFNSNNWQTPQTVTVTGVDDNVIDGDQDFDVSVTWYKTQINDSGESETVVGDEKVVKVTNKDNDKAGVVLSDADNLVTTENKDSATFTLTLSVKPEAPVTLKLSSDNTAEGVVDPSEITIDPEDWNVPQHIDVIGVGDLIVDGDQPYNVKIEFESEDANFNGIEPVLVPVTNTDTNTVGIAVSPKTDLVVAEDGTYVEFQVLLTKAPTDNVTVIANSSDETEGLLAVVVYPKPQEPEPGSELLADGAECEKGKDCQSGICEAESEDEGAKMVCVGLPGDELFADGAECEKDEDCKSGSCKPESEDEGAKMVCVAQPGDEPEPEPEPEVSEMAVSQTLAFTAENWNEPQIIRVIGIPDTVIDGDIPFKVTLSASSNDEAYINIEESVDVTNLDKTEAGVIVEHDSIDEETGDKIKITDFSLTTNEAGGTDSFTVRLVSEPTSDVTINLSSSNTEEGTVSPASLTFNASNWNSPQTVTVTGIDDSVADKDVAYTVELANVVSEDENYNGKFGKTINAVNIDNETVGITVNPPNSPFEILENAAQVNIKMALKSEPKSSVKIYHETDNTDIVNFKKGNVVIKPENWSKGAQIGIKGRDNNYADGNKEFVLHFRTESDDPDYNDLKVDITGKRLDDEKASVVISKTQLHTNEDGLSDSFTVTLTSEPYKPVTVSFTGIDSTEGTFSPTQIVFDELNWNDEIPVTVIGKDDNEVDGSITYNVTPKVTSEDPAYNNLTLNKISVTNDNNDKGSVTVSTNAINITDSGSFTVKLDYKPMSNVEIPVVSTNTTYGTVSTSKLTFTPSNWSTPQTVTVTTKTYPYRNQKSSYQIKLGNTVSSSTEYNNITVSSVAVTGNPSTVVYNYAYTGGVQTRALPAGTYRLEVWGAQGGGSNTQTTSCATSYVGNIGSAGMGGYAAGNLKLTSSTTVYVQVGGVGTCSYASNSAAPGGYNGGGTGGSSSSGEPGGGGGGGTDIRIGSNSLYARVIVAGGGGGGGEDSGDPYGHGGGLTGVGYSGYDATQTSAGSNGSFGTGASTGNSPYGDGGGGGGGWYGGGTSKTSSWGSDTQGGGGGSGYVYTSSSASNYPSGCLLNSSYYLTDTQLLDGTETFNDPSGKAEYGHAGNGYAVIYKIAN